MIYVGIDVAKDKHDCFISDSDGKALLKAFSFSNNKDGFDDLYRKILSVSDDLHNIKASVYVLLSEFPSASDIASAHLTRLTNLLHEASKGRYGKDAATLFRETARASIGSRMPAKSMELRHTIRLIQELTAEIDEIETETKNMKYFSPIHSDKFTF